MQTFVFGQKKRIDVELSIISSQFDDPDFTDECNEFEDWDSPSRITQTTRRQFMFSATLYDETGVHPLQAQVDIVWLEIAGKTMDRPLIKFYFAPRFSEFILLKVDWAYIRERLQHLAVQAHFDNGF